MAAPRYCVVAVASALVVAGCHHRLPAEPLVEAMPGPYKSAEAYQLDIASCQQFARTEMLTLPRAAGRPQVRLDAAYAECMARQGNSVPGYPEPMPVAYAPPPSYRRPVRPVARPAAAPQPQPPAAAMPVVPGTPAPPPASVAPPNWVAPVAPQ